MTDIKIPQDIKILLEDQNIKNSFDQYTPKYHPNVYFISAIIHKFSEGKDISYEMSVFNQVLNHDIFKDKDFSSLSKEEVSKTMRRWIIKLLTLDIKDIFIDEGHKFSKDEQKQFVNEINKKIA